MDGDKNKFITERNNVEQIKEIHNITPVVVLSNALTPYIVDDLLIIVDYKSHDKGIHIYDKNSFEYIRSTGRIGKGPGEIVRYGILVPSKNEQKILMPDHGKQVNWEFHLDSIRTNSEYLPKIRSSIKDHLFFTDYALLSDSVALGNAVMIKGSNSFDEVVGKGNFSTGKIEEYGYVHPITKRGNVRSSFALAKIQDKYIKAYVQFDLITICDLEGNLVKNIYGPEWKENIDDRKEYFIQAEIMGNYIVVSFLNEEEWIVSEQKRPVANLPSQLIIYNLEGDYLKTIDVGHKFYRFTLDEENNRVLAFFTEREQSLGYFNLEL